VLGPLVSIAIAGIAETLVAVAAGEGPAPGVHYGVLHHVGLRLGHVAAITALRQRKHLRKNIFNDNR
jgi:hypothetical protein